MRVGFVMEQILGHVTHAQNLKRAVSHLPHIAPTYLDVPFTGGLGLLDNLPVIRSKWSLRASLNAYWQLRPHAGKLDAVLFHTHMTSLFSTRFTKRLPCVISLDSPPFNRYESYFAISETERSIAYKNRAYRRIFKAAAHIVAWSQWVKTDLVAYYDVPEDKITVIPPGIATADWKCADRPSIQGRNVHLLFVGADFARKGGETLLEAFRLLPAACPVHLHIVTRADLPAHDTARITVYKDIVPNSPRLIELFQRADVFVLPTRSDCLPLAVLEAMAAGLPVITTDIGGLTEAVEDGVNGSIIPANDAPALAEAITSLTAAPDRLRAQSRASSRIAVTRFEAATNYGRLIKVLQNVGEQASA